MAITTIGSTSIESSGTTQSITVPAGVTAAHLGLIFIGSADGVALAPTIPSWTAIVTDPAGQSNSATYVFKRLGGQVAGNTITVTYNKVIACKMTAIWYDTSGQDLAVVGSAGTRNAVSLSTNTIPGVTTTVANQDVIVFSAERTTATGTVISSWTPSTPTQDYFNESATGSAVSHYIGHFTQVTAGATGNYVATYNGASGNGAGVLLSVTASVASTPWINRTFVQGPRNGSTSHTVSFTPATAGNFLIAVAYGLATSTAPSGWTQPTGGSAVNNGGLYFWYKTATSFEGSFTTAHNGTNYPIAFEIFEFAAGSTFGSAVSAASNANSSATPAISGQTGTSLYMAFAGMAVSSTAGTNTTTWSLGTKIADTLTLAVSGDGYAYSSTYLSSTATSFAPAATFTTAGGITAVNHEGIVVKLTVGSSGGTNLQKTTIGSTVIASSYFGSTAVSKMYIGNTQIFP